MLGIRGTKSYGLGRLVLCVIALGAGACCSGQAQRHAAVNAGDVIDKQAELAELSLAQCKAHDDAKCDDVAVKLGKIRSSAADLKSLEHK